MRTTFTVCFLGIALAWTGCATDGGDGGPELLRDDIPDPPEGGEQMVSQTFEIPANSEVFMCMRIPYVPTERMLVQDSAVYQTENGHHTMVFYSNNSAGVNPDPHECEGIDMTDVRIITTGAANGAGLAMPEGVALEVPAGAEVWIQSHYINTTSEARIVQDVINLTLVDESEVEHIASTFAHVDLTLSLPPGEETMRTMECTIPHDMNVPWVLPHMHDWGKYFEIEITRGEEQLYFYEGDWFASFRDDFPIQDLQQTLELKAGDKIRTTCVWQNTESHQMLWPEEMCVTFFPFYPGDGSLMACDESGDVFEP